MPLSPYSYRSGARSLFKIDQMAMSMSCSGLALVMSSNASGSFITTGVSILLYSSKLRLFCTAFFAAPTPAAITVTAPTNASTAIKSPSGNAQRRAPFLCFFVWFAMVFTSSYLPVAVDFILHAHKLRQPQRPAGVQFLGGNADFRAEAELAAVGKAGTRVVIYRRGIDFV